MSQQQQLSASPEVPECTQQSCQCSAIGCTESIRSQRDRGSMRMSNNLDSLQNVFEPIRRIDSPLQDSQQMNLDRNVEILDHQASSSLSQRSIENQNGGFSRHGHNTSCSSRSNNLSRNLIYGSSRKLQETVNIQDERYSLTPSPTLLSDSNPGLNDVNVNILDQELDEHSGSSKPSSSSKDKIQNTQQQIYNPYQRHHESPIDHNVHEHCYPDSRIYVHKHVDYLNSSNLESNDRSIGYRSHSHHHHGKMNNSVSHHHASVGHHSHNINHSHQNAPLNLGLNSNTGSHRRPSPTVHHRHLVANIKTNEHLSSGPVFVDHHSSSGALSGTSSNSSMMNHGGSPTVHRHATNSNSLSSIPLVEHHRGSSSGSATGHSGINNHHASSGISCESSSSNANTRAHSRLDHMHDHHHHYHHHHLQSVHPLHSNHTDPRSRDRAPSSLEHHGHHHGHIHNLSHSHSQSNNDTKNTTLGLDAIQVSAPSKSKCQCHIVQQSGGSKREPESENNGVVAVAPRAHQPPALPPRPPPRPVRSYETTTTSQCHTGEGGCCKKYVVLCCLCGGLSTAVGSLFLAVHVVLSSHTASLALFETVPSYIPGIMLIMMGLFTMLLARRKHRYGLLMKVCGSVGVVCALVCVLVTVTTTVVHMSRLQGLRECVYTVAARSCTCYGAQLSKGDPGVLFEGIPHCEAVHGALYACLRALFGVSVAGILACIFSCMLVYQLLSHEKKKMYWEQLELRCRSFYGPGATVGPAPGSCGCCNDCGGASPWWAQTPGNLYTPNPDLAPSRRWRLPWSRSRGPAPSPDSNYGFHTQVGQTDVNVDNATSPYSVLNSQSAGPYSVLNTQNVPYTPSTASYSVLEAPVPLWGPPPPYSDPNSPARRPQVSEPRPRIAKRIENYETNEDHRARAAKRPADKNYENSEEVSNSTDPEGGNEGGTMKNRRTRKPLKGVENNGFQQEANAAQKQSESELYFGDVSSCCGPESSFYDLAVEKEAAEHMEGVDYLSTRLGKRQLSKRSRMPLPLPVEGTDEPSENYVNGDEAVNARGPFLAPDAQYEVIQQGRYAYYKTRNDEDLQEEPVSTAYFHEEEADRSRDREYRDYRRNQEDETAQCCLSDSTTLDSGWQSGEQPPSDENVQPVDV